MIGGDGVRGKGRTGYEKVGLETEREWSRGVRS